MEIGNQKLTLALFTDDVLLFLKRPKTGLPNLKIILEDYGFFSGLKINYSKSEILPLTNKRGRQWQVRSPFKVAHNSIKYLDINIGQTFQTLYNLNYTPLINKIVKELGPWTDLPISLFGRAHLFKLTSFAKLLYPLERLPLQLKTIDIKKVNIALTHFLWQGKRPKIALSKLWLPKPEGGQHTESQNIQSDMSNETRYGLDNPIFKVFELFSRTRDLQTMAHDSIATHTSETTAHTSTPQRSYKRHWRGLRKSTGLSAALSSYTPIRQNPLFPQGDAFQPYRESETRGILRFHDLFQVDAPWTPKPFLTLRTEYDLLQYHSLYYMQITFF